MKVGSLFTGIGGFDLGFERAGFEIAWQAEIDQQCRAVLSRHWPQARVVDDVRLVGTHHPFATCPPECEEGCVRDEFECIGISQLQDADEDGVNVIVGGFPCQDISSAGDRWGNRGGTDGSRSGLWWEFARIIQAASPEWVVIENTGRLRNGRDGADLKAVVERLDSLSYVGWSAVLDAAAFNLPMRRPRVFIVARKSRTSGGFSEGQRLASHFNRHDPGCFVLEGTGQPLATNDGANRPVAGTYRLLSPVECERALGFPDNWTFGPDSVRRKMCGNAVAVPVAEWIANRIHELA